MWKIKIVLISFMLTIVNLVYAYDDGDFQIWSTEVQEFKINKDLKVALEEEFRFGDNADDFFYHHYDLGFTYSLNKSLNLGAGYRHIYEKKKGKFKLENEPYLIFAYKWEWFKFKFDDRSRLEYRHFEYQTDSWRYRNKFTLRFPFRFTKLEIQPYLSDEIFLNFYGAAFTKNRFYSGLEFTVTKNIRADVYYLLEHTKTGRIWPDVNVLGTKIKILF